MHVGVKPSAHGPYCPAHPVHTPVHTVKAEAPAVGYRRVMSRLLYVTLILYATGGGNTGIRAYYEPISEPRAATGHTSGHSTFSFDDHVHDATYGSRIDARPRADCPAVWLWHVPCEKQRRKFRPAARRLERREQQRPDQRPQTCDKRQDAGTTELRPRAVRAESGARPDAQSRGEGRSVNGR